MECMGPGRGSLEFERVLVDHIGCYALQASGPALECERYVGPFGVCATHAVGVSPVVRVDPWGGAAASVFTSASKAALGVDSYVGSRVLSATPAMSVPPVVRVGPWSGADGSVFTAAPKTVLGFDSYVGSPALTAPQGVSSSRDVMVDPWRGADGSVFTAAPKTVLGFDPYIGSCLLSATHGLSWSHDPRGEPWSDAHASVLTVAPREAVGLGGPGGSSPCLSATHTAMSSPGLMRGALEFRHDGAIGVHGAFGVRPHPWHVGVADLQIAAPYGTNTIPCVDRPQDPWEDPRERSPRTDFSPPAWHRREAKLRRLVGKLRRQVTDLKVEVEEQKAWMAEWFEWLESEWFASQIAPSHPEDEAFNV